MTQHSPLIKRFLPNIIGFFLLGLAIVPTLALAQGADSPYGKIIPNCGSNHEVRDAKGVVIGQEHECGFLDLIQLIKNVINTLILYSTLLATAAFAYVGIKLLVSQGDPGAMKEAKGTAIAVLKGYVWILVAWLLIYTITSALLQPNEGYSILGSPN